MIKPIKIDSLNRTHYFHIECTKCGLKQDLKMFEKGKVRDYDLDSEADTEVINVMQCPRCKAELNNKNPQK